MNEVRKSHLPLSQIDLIRNSMWEVRTDDFAIITGGLWRYHIQMRDRKYCTDKMTCNHKVNDSAISLLPINSMCTKTKRWKTFDYAYKSRRSIYLLSRGSSRWLSCLTSPWTSCWMYSVGGF